MNKTQYGVRNTFHTLHRNIRKQTLGNSKGEEKMHTKLSRILLIAVVVLLSAIGAPVGHQSFADALPPESGDGSLQAASAPALLYSTYLGGAGDDVVNDVALGNDGSIYIAGYTYSDEFGSESSSLSSPDVFVAKFSSNGRTVEYFKRFGGDSQDVGNAIAVDDAGNAYVTGYTHGENFPYTDGAYDTDFNGGVESAVDAFVTQLDADGDIVYSTFLGGSGHDVPNSSRMGGVDIGDDIAFDGNYVYVTGSTESDDFPTTDGAYDTEYADVSSGLSQDIFIVKLLLAGQEEGDLAYGTFVGGGASTETGNAIAVDSIGAIYVGGYVQDTVASSEFPLTPGAVDTDPSDGWEAFMLKLNPGGQEASDLIYSTYLGGKRSDYTHAVLVDDAGTVYLTGETGSPAPGFPITDDAYDDSCGTDGNCNYVEGLGAYADAFVTRINPDPGGTAEGNLLYSTFLGGEDYENQMGDGDLALVEPGELYVSGSTRSPDTFPTTPDAFARERTGTSSDAFVVRLRMGTSDDLIYGSYVGGNDVDGANAIAWNGSNIVTVVGETWNTLGLYGDFPTTPDALYPDHNGGGTYSYDGILFRMQAPPAPDLSASAKTVAPEEAARGDIVTYTVRLVNSGTVSATVALTDTLPETLAFHGPPTASAGGVPVTSADTLTWTGTVTDGATVTITYAALLTSTTTLTPTAVNEAQIDDGAGNIYLRRVFVNACDVFLPLVLR
jgi:uncharacterized repeat protein (TIGR01451 family)